MEIKTKIEVVGTKKDGFVIKTLTVETDYFKNEVVVKDDLYITQEEATLLVKKLKTLLK